MTEKASPFGSFLLPVLCDFSAIVTIIVGALQRAKGAGNQAVIQEESRIVIVSHFVGC
jgi:hypothetical protein